MQDQADLVVLDREFREMHVSPGQKELGLRMLKTRLQVFVRVHVVLLILEKDDPLLRQRVVNAVNYCSLKNKQGDPEFWS